MPGKTPIFWITAGIGALLIAAYAALWLALGDGRDTLMAFWPFSGVGLAGALVANSTGVGGGVVFVPAFSMLRETGTLDISPIQTIGVSFAIQCFGMTVGSLTWLNRFYRPDIHPVEVSHRPMLWRIIVLVLPPALIALFLAQYALRLDAHLAFLLFKLFSILLGSALLTQLIISRNKGQEREELVRGEAYILAGVGPLASAKAARWMRSNVPGIHIPDAVISRLEAAKNPGDEGRKICVELIQQMRETPGVAGVHVMAYRREHLVADILREAGVTPKTRRALSPPSS